MLSYTLGPFLALLPRRWRDLLPITRVMKWRPAMILSGLMESVLALVALVYWYSYSVTHWAADAVFSAIEHGAEIDPNALGFAGLAITFLHPLTWLIAYCGVEGIIRLCAAFTDTAVGVLPLFLADKTFLLIAGRRSPEPKPAANISQDYLASILGALRERISAGKLPLVPDELRFTQKGSEEILEIRSCRAKADWIPPRVVRHEDRYYQLEASSPGIAPRPFVYELRRLSRGVPGRTVLNYAPEPAPVLADR